MFTGWFNPFLKKFPEERPLWLLNQKRINGFLKYTAKAIKNRTAASIDVKAAQQIQKLNSLGFITVDSQEGIHDEEKNPTYHYGKEKGQPLRNKEGSPALVAINSERAYCDGFILTTLLDTFESQLKACNPNVIVLRYPRQGDRVNLTKEYIQYEDGSEYKDDFTNSPEYTAEDLQEYVINTLLSGTSSHYIGPPLPLFPVDLSKWTYILTIDMEYGHHALTEDGLFTCIHTALTATLKTVKGGLRKTRKVLRKKRHSTVGTLN